MPKAEIPHLSETEKLEKLADIARDLWRWRKKNYLVDSDRVVLDVAVGILKKAERAKANLKK